MFKSIDKKLVRIFSSINRRTWSLHYNHKCVHSNFLIYLELLMVLHILWSFNKWKYVFNIWSRRIWCLPNGNCWNVVFRKSLSCFGSKIYKWTFATLWKELIRDYKIELNSYSKWTNNSNLYYRSRHFIINLID